MKKFGSSFKNYFSSYIFKSVNIKTHMSRFNEKFFKDKKFRFKIVILTVGVVYIVNLFMISGTNLLFQKQVKKMALNFKSGLSKYNYVKNKDSKSLDKLINTQIGKVNYMIKNDLFDENSIKIEIKKIVEIVQEFYLVVIKLFFYLEL